MLYLIGKRGYTSGRGSLKLGFTRDNIKTDRIESYALPEREDLLGTREGGLDLEYIMHRKLKFLGVKYTRRESYEERPEVFQVFSETKEELYDWLWEHREKYVCSCKCPDLIPNLYSSHDINLHNYSENPLDSWWYWNYTRSEVIKAYSTQGKLKKILKSREPEEFPKGYRDLLQEFSDKVLRFIPSRAELLSLYQTKEPIRELLMGLLGEFDEVPENEMLKILWEAYKGYGLKRKPIDSSEIYVYFPRSYYRKNHGYIIKY